MARWSRRDLHSLRAGGLRRPPYRHQVGRGPSRTPQVDRVAFATTGSSRATARTPPSAASFDPSASARSQTSARRRVIVGPNSSSPPLPPVAHFANTYRQIAPTGTPSPSLRFPIVLSGSTNEYSATSDLKFASGSSADHGPTHRSKRTTGSSSGIAAVSHAQSLIYLHNPPQAHPPDPKPFCARPSPCIPEGAACCQGAGFRLQ